LAGRWRATEAIVREANRLLGDWQIYQRMAQAVSP